MNEAQKRRRAKKVSAGDGRVLQPFRWWQQFGRVLFFLEASADGDSYAVDVRHWGNQSGGEVRAHLYLRGRQVAVSKIPAAFPIPGGVIDVAMSPAGLKRCHFIADSGHERRLSPDPRSAEGRRARFEARHPGASRIVGALAIVMLVIGAGLLALQVMEPLSQIPAIADRFGTFHSPVQLPLWLNIALGVGAAAGSADRALRLKYSWLDSAGN